MLHFLQLVKLILNLMSMLQTRDLSFAYNSRNKFYFPDINLESGDHLLIVGKSGIGKTTLLHLLAGILKSNQGEISIENSTLSSMSSRELDHFRGKYIGLVFQRPHFIQSLTLKENMLLIQHLAGMKQNEEKIITLLERLDLLHKIDEKPQKLSIGQQQRANIAMALLNQTKLLLADEPTSSLDDENCDVVIELLKEQSHLSGANLVVITHDNRLKSHFNNRIEL